MNKKNKSRSPHNPGIASRGIIGEFARFHRNDQGALVAIVAIFTIPLLLMFFIMINTGSALLTRMRAQGLADAASFSAATWQARFLNYCAYTRRHMVGNYATMAMLTGYIDMGKMLTETVYNAKGLYTRPSNGMIPGNFESIDAMLAAAEKSSPGLGKSLNSYISEISRQGAVKCPGDYAMFPLGISSRMRYTSYLWLSSPAGLDALESIRESCDVMNGYLSLSQEAMHAALLYGGTEIMQHAVKSAQGDNTSQKTTFSINTKKSSLMFKNLVQSGIPTHEIEAYYDKYTKAEVSQSILTGGFAQLARKASGRSPRGNSYSDRYVLFPGRNERLFIWNLNLESDKVTIGDRNIKANTCVPTATTKSYFKEQTGQTTSYYCWFLQWIYVYGIPVPVYYRTPIVSFLGGGWHRENYSMIYPMVDAPVYELDNNANPSDWEPSCLAVVEADTTTAPFVGTLTRLNIGIDALLPNRKVMAMSRAKAYFRGPDENLKNSVYQKPNLNYPFWGAKLAAIKGNDDTFKQATDVRKENVAAYQQQYGKSSGNYQQMGLNY
ncbi:TPA: hypothetical protein DDW35_01400 [Candidatus Sumerlaeota bacterium]|jgi:hypothetical protein|nr:hypothetical protein [Candidatus Sumerlaeota bacterium]